MYTIDIIIGTQIVIKCKACFKYDKIYCQK